MHRKYTERYETQECDMAKDNIIVFPLRDLRPNPGGGKLPSTLTTPRREAGESDLATSPFPRTMAEIYAEWRDRNRGARTPKRSKQK